jgi:hypothetical protein
MKNIKYIVLLCLAFTLSCNDAIDIQQVGRLTPEVAFETVQDLQRGLNAVYASFDPTKDIAMNTTYADEVAPGIGTGGQGNTTGFIFELNPGSAAPFQFWTDGYRELNRINRLIEGINLVEPLDAAEQTEIDNILGATLALRAYSHFRLLSYFSTDLTDDNALGVILMDFVPSISAQLLRNTNGEIFDVIESDLTDAESLLTDQASASRTFISRDFVTALRARIAAYRGDYTTALPLATSLINSYPLASRDDFPGIWLDENNAEVIFKFERTFNGPFDFQGATGSVAANGWVGNIWAFTNATVGGGAYYEWSRNLFNLFDAADIRRDAYLAPSSVISPDYQNAADYFNEDLLIVGKYPGSENQNLMNDIKIFRTGEMVLIQAEAYAEAGSLNGAANSVAAAIKTLRDARFEDPQPLPTFSNPTQAWAAILNERRVELAFEGHRWLDIKRLGALGNQNIVRDPLDCALGNFPICEIPFTDHRFTLPLPLAEFDGNPGLREQQNPGYN